MLALTHKFFLLLTLFSLNTFAQSRSGRGEDWYDDYSGDGGYFFYFLIAFWGFVFSVALLRIIYEAILENGKRWFKAFLDELYFFLKTFENCILDFPCPLRSSNNTLKCFENSRNCLNQIDELPPAPCTKVTQALDVGCKCVE